MPVNPSAFVSGEPVSAKKLNTDLYTYVPGNAYTPNGILFHAQKPALLEVQNANVTDTCAYSTAGAFSFLNAALTWQKVWDGAAYYGPGLDYAHGTGSLQSQVLGANGLAGTSPAAGGFYWVGGHIATVQQAAILTAGCGIGYNSGGSPPNTGPSPLCSAQLASTTRNNCAFMLDLVHADTAAESFGAGVWLSGTASGTTTPADHVGADWSADTSRLHGWWASVDVANGTTVSGGPTPPGTFTGASALTSASLNAGIVNTLNFLNMPPTFRRATALGTAITTGTVTTVPLGSGTLNPSIDTYSAWNSSTNVYTVPVSGVYLVTGSVAYAPVAASFDVCAGLLVNAATTPVQLEGGFYSTSNSANAGAGTIPTITSLLDLQAGDTISLTTRHNRGSNASLWNTTPTTARMCLQWVGALGTPSTLWTNPDTGFRWQAGTGATNSPSNLVAQFNAHLTNDLGFLISKPYLLTYQTAAGITTQGSFAANAAGTLVMDQAKGRIHGSTGDSYSGWTTGSGNHYTAQRAGWYLVVGDYCFAGNASKPFSMIAQVTANAGNQATPYYWGQHLSWNTSFNPGATFVNLQYLRVGDTISPTGTGQPANGTNTWTTAAVTTQASNFGLIWLSQ